ncbi:hypothetical protein PVAP13_3NG182900 [Panicum virgatum]|uniref:Uncharacterized protein n=1 Tax=Panicum virgatum TaxID=38727 RepID=A0A8T0UH27_PANVG|nr:hypothetical protein PVAP13_3NG182900 [Panicum virgatum]
MTPPPKEARSEGDGEGGVVEQPAAKRMKLAVPVGVAGEEPEAAADPTVDALPGANEREGPGDGQRLPCSIAPFTSMD